MVEDFGRRRCSDAALTDVVLLALSPRDGKSRWKPHRLGTLLMVLCCDPLGIALTGRRVSGDGSGLAFSHVRISRSGVMATFFFLFAVSL
jgi:hypothetical protein